MVGLVEERLAAVRELCRGYNVKQLELFGSGAEDGFRPQSSDLDFLVEFLPVPPARHADSYFGLLEALQELFGCPVDLVETPQLCNPFFLDAIRPTRTVLCAA